MKSSYILRARLPAFVGLCLVSALLIAGCSAPWQQGKAASGTKPTTQQLFANLQKSFRTVTSFHVVMQTKNLGKAASGQVQIRNADGDVVMPDKVKAQATVILSGQAVTVKLVSIGSTQFITDPISGQWRVVKGVLDPRTLTNPDTGIISLVSKLQNVSQPTDDVVNNVPCWRVTGQLAAKYLAFLTGGGVPSGTMLQTSVCVGKSDSLPYQIIVMGRAAASDTAETSRTFVLSNYNENVSITAPQI